MEEEDDDDDDDRPAPARSKVERFSFCVTAMSEDELAELKKITARSKALLCTWTKDWRTDTSHLITAMKPGSNAAAGARPRARLRGGGCLDGQQRVEEGLL